MNLDSPIRTIGWMLVPTIIATMICSYVPHDLTLIRHLLSWVQLALIGVIAMLAVRYLLEES